MLKGICDGDLLLDSSSAKIVLYRACYFACRDLKGSFKGDTDIDVEVDVDIDSYFGCLKGGFKVSFGSVCGIEAVMVLTTDAKARRLARMALAKWYSTDFDICETASPVLAHRPLRYPLLHYPPSQNKVEIRVNSGNQAYLDLVLGWRWYIWR